MPCCLGFALLGLPRLAILSLALTSDYIGDAFARLGLSIAAPLLGLLFLPWTTLAVAWSTHNGDGELATMHWVLIVFAALTDIGALGGGSSRHNKD